MSTTAVADGDPLAVDRDGLRAREPQLLDDREHVLARRRGSRAALPSWGTGSVESVSRMTTPGPLIATSPAAIAGLWSWSFRSPVTAVAALAGRLEVLDRGPQLEHLLLEALLLCLEVEGGLDERRPLEARVADPRTLGGELRSDEEPEGEQRRPERDLPARDRADARPIAVMRTAPRRRATTRPTTTAPTTRTRPAEQQRDRRSRQRSRSAPGSPRRAPAVVPGRASGRRGRRRSTGRGRSSPTGAGPAGAGCGPKLLRRRRAEARRASPPGTSRGRRPAPW